MATTGEPASEARPNGRDVAVVVLVALVLEVVVIGGFYGWAIEFFTIGPDSVRWSVLLLVSVIEIEAVFLGGVWYRGLPVRAIGLRGPEPGWVAKSGRVALVVLVAWLSAIALAFSNFSASHVTLPLFPIALMILDACTFGPLGEELIFRGVLYTWLRRKRGLAFGILATSALFAGFHYIGESFGDIDLADVLSKFLFGMCLALVYERSRSLWVAIALHAMTNGSIMLIGLFY